jgi:hypothetical protein
MNKQRDKSRSVFEPSRETPVLAEAEVVVVGGGPAGAAAAIAAAREGAETILIERYGSLGGMATGGLVLMINQYPPGLCCEILDRLRGLGGVRDLNTTAEPGPMRQSHMVDPEILKCLLNDMALEAGVTPVLHCWSTAAICGDRKVTGVITESKSGRTAVLGRVVIDATGDGDIFASAGADHESEADPNLRSSQLAMVFRIGGVNYDAFVKFRVDDPEGWQKLREELHAVAGFRVGPVAANRDDLFWINSFITGRSPINVKDLTAVETQVRHAMIPVHELLKKQAPGFWDSYLYDSASQIGTRGSRRLRGRYVLTKDDAFSHRTFDDTVAVFPQGVPLGLTPEEMPRSVGLPYRCLVPKDVDGLLTAGRCFSSDATANTMFNVIPHCISMGQAAGMAAAIAVKLDLSPGDVPYPVLKDRLAAQGVPLP